VSVKSVLNNTAATPASMFSQNATTTIVTNTTKFTQHDPSSTQAGNYLDSNAHIYITVSIAQPLTTQDQLVAQSRNTTVRTFSSSTVTFN
jgi:hypothetical protein